MIFTKAIRVIFPKDNFSGSTTKLFKSTKIDKNKKGEAAGNYSNKLLWKKSVFK